MGVGKRNASAGGNRLHVGVCGVRKTSCSTPEGKKHQISRSKGGRTRERKKKKSRV